MRAPVLGHRLRAIADVRADIQRGAGRHADPAARSVKAARTSAGAGQSGRQSKSGGGLRAHALSASSAAISPCMSSGSGASHGSSRP